MKCSLCEKEISKFSKRYVVSFWKGNELINLSFYHYSCLHDLFKNIEKILKKYTMILEKEVKANGKKEKNRTTSEN